MRLPFQDLIKLFSKFALIGKVSYFCADFLINFESIFVHTVEKFIKKDDKKSHFNNRMDFLKNSIVKRYFTLLEVVIAMGMTLVILTTLTFFYQQIFLIGQDVDKIEIESFRLRLLENRLSSILPAAVGPEDTLRDFVFFTSSEDYGLTKPGSSSLIFTFNGGVNLDKGYSDHVIGRLFLDPQGRLIMAYWPTPKWWKDSEAPLPKIEILLENVEELFFEFFIPPDIGKPKAKAALKQGEPPSVEPEPKGEWRKNGWPIEFRQLPAMVRVILSQKGTQRKQTFIYPLPEAKKIITYPMSL